MLLKSVLNGWRFCDVTEISIEWMALLWCYWNQYWMDGAFVMLLKSVLKGWRFCDVTEINIERMTLLLCYWNQYWMDGAFVMLLKSLRMRPKSWKCFHKMVSRNVSNTFTAAGKSVYLHKGSILKETQLKLLYCSVFLINKVFLVIFWSYYVSKHTSKKAAEHFILKVRHIRFITSTQM